MKSKNPVLFLVVCATLILGSAFLTEVRPDTIQFRTGEVLKLECIDAFPICNRGTMVCPPLMQEFPILNRISTGKYRVSKPGTTQTLELRFYPRADLILGDPSSGDAVYFIELSPKASFSGLRVSMDGRSFANADSFDMVNFGPFSRSSISMVTAPGSSIGDSAAEVFRIGHCIIRVDPAPPVCVGGY